MKNIWLIALIGIVLGTVSCSKDDDKDPEPTVYSVTYETEGGAPAPVAQKIEAGGTATVPATNPAKTGYVFLFWHLSGSSTAYNFQTPITGNITLHAKWQEEAIAEYWQVAWTLNGGTWPSGDNHAAQVLKGGTLAEPNAPTKTSNTFEGWYKEEALTNKVSFPYDVSNVTTNFTLYAKWTAGGTTDPDGYTIFTSIAEMKTWLDKQYNSEKTPYKVGLKGLNLDTGNNWGDVGKATNSNKYIYVDLNLQGCTGTTIPDGYKSGNTTYGVFVDCDNLISIYLPNGVRSIGKYAFYHCDNLVSVTLPEGVKSIGELTFGWCIKLEGITLQTGLQSIDKKAFVSCEKLKYATLPDGLMYMGEEIFWGCNSLESIRIPESIKVIGDDMFYSCDALASVSLPEGIQYIGNWFYSCESLTSISIPASVTSINKGVFSTVPLSEIIMLPETPPSLGTNVFKLKNPLDPTSFSVTIKVPAISLNVYKTASGWKDYTSKIVANTN